MDKFFAKQSNTSKIIYDDYRYEPKSDSVSMEEQKRKIEKEQKRLKEMEDNLKKKNADSVKPAAKLKTTETDEKTNTSGKSFPMLTLERMFS